MLGRTLMICCLAGIAAFAHHVPCQVPVFRYALERWSPDPHEVLVLTEGPLSAKHAKLLEQLRPDMFTGAPVANLRVRILDGTDDESERLIAEWKQAHPSDPLPQVVVRSPDVKQGRPLIWSAPLSQQSLDQMVDSPARQAMAEELLDGTSAVWLLLESGNRELDDKAKEVLSKRLRHLEETLELSMPDAQDIADGFDPSKLKLKFVMLPVSRDEPEEGFLIRSLLNLESDLQDEEFRGLPIAFPVFGRGRALYALIGDGIADDVIDEACQFLIGPCSCQVKEQNPGVDLMMAVDWDALVEDSINTDVELPPLQGLGTFARPEAREAQPTPAGVVVQRQDAAEAKGQSEPASESTRPDVPSATATPEATTGGVYGVLAGVGFIGILGILILTMMIMKQ